MLTNKEVPTEPNHLFPSQGVILGFITALKPAPVACNIRSTNLYFHPEDFILHSLVVHVVTP